MSIQNPVLTGGGNRNIGRFIDTNKRICAAGKPSLISRFDVSEYLLQDEVDALISDAIIPPPPPIKLPPLKKPRQVDRRNAVIAEVGSLINSPLKTKFQTLVEDLKSTVYSSYWNKPVGIIRDPTPNLPNGFNIYETTLGHKPPKCDRLLDVIYPKDPVPDKTRIENEVGYQKDRKYLRPPYDPDRIYGVAYKMGKGSQRVACAMQDDTVKLGTSNKLIKPKMYVDFKEARTGALGTVMAPCNNISNVPDGFTFGKKYPPGKSCDWMYYCELNPNREFFLKCVGYLNSVRICFKKRFDASFFRHLYLSTKYYDKNKTGWISKDTIYNLCVSKLVRFDSTLIEPLLYEWNVFNGTEIEYKTFINVLDPTQEVPKLPKVWHIPDHSFEYSTTYRDMVSHTDEKDTSLMAGLPSGRYFDLDYPISPAGLIKAHRTDLPEESDARSNLCPSNLTNHGISHRDMFAVRSPQVVRDLFEKVNDIKFTDEEFNGLWNEAKEYHPKGFVSFATFFKVFDKER